MDTHQIAFDLLTSYQHPSEGAQREHLAAIQHAHWARETRALLADLTPAHIAEVRRQCDTAYVALSEAEKGQAHAWADRVLALTPPATAAVWRPGWQPGTWPR